MGPLYCICNGEDPQLNAGPLTKVNLGCFGRAEQTFSPNTKPSLFFDLRLERAGISCLHLKFEAGEAIATSTHLRRCVGYWKTLGFQFIISGKTKVSYTVIFAGPIRAIVCLTWCMLRDRFETESVELKIEPIVRAPQTDLNSLMSTLEVNVVALSEYLVSRGSRLEMGAASVTGLHYNLKGVGKCSSLDFRRSNSHPIRLLFFLQTCRSEIETSASPGKSMPPPHPNRSSTESSGPIRRYVAGNSEPEVVMICGFFSAFYGSSTDVFSSLSEPIVEQFDETDRLDGTLKLAISELIKQELGSGAMSAAILKQVIITILRRSLTSVNL